MNRYEIVTEYGTFNVEAHKYLIFEGGQVMFRNIERGGTERIVAVIGGNYFLRRLDGADAL